MSDNLLRTGERFFLSPVCLVPNGRAHLGHICGPLLRMDVLRRHLLRADALALAINTSDSHESHVAVQAFREGATPESLASRYHKQIRSDLLALGIEWDDFIDPLDETWNATYTSVVTDLVERIVLSQNTIARATQIPILVSEDGPSPYIYRPQLGEPVVSGWLRGACPACGEILAGFFCERCGGYFEPAEMLNPGTAYFDGEIALKSHSSLFLDIPISGEEMLKDLGNRGVTPSFRRVLADHLARAGSTIRLTVPNRWGVPWRQPELNGEVIWSYSALLIACHLTAGELFSQLNGAGNPFLAGSDVTCVISFGVDNTIPYLLGAQGCLLSQDLYKPVDAFLTNHFALMDGEKFSTSRRHVIWGGDLVFRARANPDLARLLLCLTNPEFARVDFNTRQFQADYARLAHQLSGSMANALRLADRAVGAHEPDASILSLLEAELICQSAHLNLKSFHLKAAAATLVNWLDGAVRLQQDAVSALTWLFGLALLGEPFLPGLARRLWCDLNQDGIPRLKGHRSRKLEAISQTCLTALEPLDPRRFDSLVAPEEFTTSTVGAGNERG
jgi:methionyl-tRNA synthetase